jgi:hypothetical protein
LQMVGRDAADVIPEFSRNSLSSARVKTSVFLHKSKHCGIWIRLFHADCHSGRV